MTKEDNKSMTASEWTRKNLNDTTLALSEDSARLFTALYIGGLGSNKFKITTVGNSYTFA